MKKIYLSGRNWYLFPVMVLCLCSEISAQDLHFSMFQNAPLNLNPALTGIYSGNQRFSASLRRQWFSVPVDYMTFTGSYDRKFLRQGATSFWSGGILFDYDRAGTADLSTAFLGVSGSYTHGLSPSVLLTGGAMIGGGQRGSNTAGLLWGNHWDGDQVNGQLDPKEDGLDANHFYFDVSAGVNLRLQKSSRTRLDIGGGAFHITRPNDSFYPNEDFDAKVPIRLAAQAYGSIEVLPQLDLQANVLAQFAGPNQEIVLGGMLNIHVSTKKAREIQFGVGLGVRLDDALIPQVALSYDGWRAGFSYDINTSGFKIATNERGGPEFSLIYIITDVAVLDQSKLCRIF